MAFPTAVNDQITDAVVQPTKTTKKKSGKAKKAVKSRKTAKAKKSAKPKKTAKAKARKKK